jgi:hypothetical protein
MTEIEEAKARLATWANNKTAVFHFEREAMEAGRVVLAHVDRIEALSTPAPDDPVEAIVADLDRMIADPNTWPQYLQPFAIIKARIEAGDWKLPAPSAEENAS